MAMDDPLAGLFGVRPVTISRWRRWTIEDAPLNKVSQGKPPGPDGQGKADELCFDLSGCPYLPERDASEVEVEMD
jgi:hypothetical protein